MLELATPQTDPEPFDLDDEIPDVTDDLEEDDGD